MKSCVICGKELDDTANFCGRCGAKYEEEKIEEEYLNSGEEKEDFFVMPTDEGAKDTVKAPATKTSNGVGLESIVRVVVYLIAIIMILYGVNMILNALGITGKRSSPQAAVALRDTAYEMGGSLGEDEIKLKVIAAKNDSKFIIKCTAKSSEAKEIYDSYFEQTVVYYAIKYNHDFSHNSAVGMTKREAKKEIGW